MSKKTPWSNDYRDWLLQEYLAKKAKNPNFTVSSFARFLETSKTVLSDAINKKRHLSIKNAMKIACKLKLSKQGILKLISEIEANKNSKFTKPVPDFYDYIQFKEDQFELMSEWHIIALLCISQIKNHQADSKWLANKIGVSENEIESALEILKRLKLIKIKDNKIRRTSAPLYVSNNVPSIAIRKYHKQNLKLAESAIEGISVDKRYLTSFSIPTNSDKIKEVQSIIDLFREKLTKALDVENPNDVYTCAIQLFPITAIDSELEKL